MLADDAVPDPLEWEWNQVQRLKSLCKEYGEEVGGRWYKGRLKHIQAESVSRQKHVLASRKVGFATHPKGTWRTEGGNEGEQGLPTTRSKPIGWLTPEQPINGRYFATHTLAKQLLGVPPYGGCWKNDRAAPSGKDWRRYISQEGEDSERFQRARIIIAKGAL